MARAPTARFPVTRTPLIIKFALAPRICRIIVLPHIARITLSPSIRPVIAVVVLVATNSTLPIDVCRRQKMAGRKPSSVPLWFKFKNKIDLEEPTPHIDHVNVRAHNVKSVTEESYVKIKSDLFAQITAIDTEAKSKVKNQERRKVVSWSHVMKGPAENCVERHGSVIKSVHTG